MAKPVIDPKDLPDFNEDQGAAPVQSAKAAEGAPAPAQKAGYTYTPSEYTLNRLRRMPLAEIKQSLGFDIEWHIKNARDYGFLEAIAGGEFTPKPVSIFVNGNKAYATVRIYPTQKGDWNWEVHPVKQRVALGEDGRPKMDAYGKPVLEVDRNPIRKGDVIYFGKEALSDVQVDHLRLTGNLGEPVTLGRNAQGEPLTAIVSVDPFNNHELCRTSGNAIRARLRPSITVRDKEGREILVQTRGCRLNDAGIVCADVSLVSKKDGARIVTAISGNNGTLIPVGHPVEIKLAGEAGADNSISLSVAQVERLSPSVVNKMKDGAKVITYLDAKQIGELADGRSVWTGGAKDMAFVIKGSGSSFTLEPVTQKGYSAIVQYDAFSGKVNRTVDYRFALEKEQKEEQAKTIELAKSQQRTTEMEVGMHV